MRPISEELDRLDEIIYELQQLNALVGFIQISFAEGAGATDEKETAAALFHIYCRQGELIKQIKELYGDRG